MASESLPHETKSNGTEDARNLKVQEDFGFDTLPEQYVRKANSGFSFIIMCIGEAGLSTSFDSSSSPHSLPGVKLKANTYELQESNVRLKQTIVDTVGYGDQLSLEESFKPIVKYIDEQFETFLQEELKIKRSLPSFHDTRVHACLYFVCPTGHGLKSIDLVCMKMLDKKVNIIPIIAKADTVNRADLESFKANIMNDIVSNGVQIYRFPTDYEDVLGEINTALNGQIPFAVAESSEFVRVGDKLARARQYPCGTVLLENESHCNFVKLREMLVHINMEDLRDQTHTRHYELYRMHRLEQMGVVDLNNENGPISFQESYEHKRQKHQEHQLHKEKEMQQLFIARVNEREVEITNAERDLHTKFDNLERQYAEENKKLEYEKRKQEEEELTFYERKLKIEKRKLREVVSTLPKGKGIYSLPHRRYIPGEKL